MNPFTSNGKGDDAAKNQRVRVTPPSATLARQCDHATAIEGQTSSVVNQGLGSGAARVTRFRPPYMQGTRAHRYGAMTCSKWPWENLSSGSLHNSIPDKDFEAEVVQALQKIGKREICWESEALTVLQTGVERMIVSVFENAQGWNNYEAGLSLARRIGGK